MSDPRLNSVHDALYQVQTLAAAQLRLGYRPAWSVHNVEPAEYAERWTFIRDAAELARFELEKLAALKAVAP